MALTTVSETEGPIASRPPRRGFWRYAPPGRWAQFIVPLLGVAGLLFDIVALSDPADQADPAARTLHTAIAMLYTLGLVVLPYAVTWGGSILIVSAFASLPFAPPDVPASTLILAAGFVVALTSPAFIATMLGSTVVWAIAVVVADPSHGIVSVILFVAGSLSAAVGMSIRRLLVDRAESAERAQQLRDELARAAHDQRRFIAHELHDVVAHHITVIRMISNLGLRGEGQIEREVLEAIGQSAGEALEELRRLLSVLDPADAETSGAPGAGSPALERQIERVCDELRTVGLEVRRDVARDAEVDLGDRRGAILERILIEATTNVLKHGGDTTDCLIRLRVTAAAVVLEVSNRRTSVPHRPGGSTSGYGIAGMRRRAAEVGGAVDAGLDGERWVVRATLPLSR